ELMPPPHEREQRSFAIPPRNLIPTWSAPLLLYHPQLPEISSYRRSCGPSGTSSASVLVTLNSPRNLAFAPTIPLLLGNTSTISLASSSNIPRPSFVISEKSSDSRSAERRKRREMAEKLCLVRPDLVDPSYTAKRMRRLSRLKDERSVSVMQDMNSSAIGSSSLYSISVKTDGPSSTMLRREFRPASRLSCFPPSKQVTGTAVPNRPAKRQRELLDEDTEDVHQTMDWERSRKLARDVGSVLPRMMCISPRRRHIAG
ncbi:hypothetical protein EDB19DRAFT_1797839, partial [Suillus lakei]